MNPLELEIIKYLDSLKLEENALKLLNELKDNILRDGGKIDGYAVAEMLFTFNRQELRINKNLNSTIILARFDIYFKEVEESSLIGYYDYVVDFSGNFIDEFFVIEK